MDEPEQLSDLGLSAKRCIMLKWLLTLKGFSFYVVSYEEPNVQVEVSKVWVRDFVLSGGYAWVNWASTDALRKRARVRYTLDPNKYNPEVRKIEDFYGFDVSLIPYNMRRQYQQLNGDQDA